MTVTFYRHSTFGAVLILLAGCSFTDGALLTGKLNSHQGDNNANAEALDACAPNAGSPFHFRKVLLVAGTISIPSHTRDLPGLADLTSKRLQTHLEKLKRFNVFATHDSTFKSMSLGTQARVKQLGEDFSSQFVVKIEIEDLTIHSSIWWLPKLIGNRKRNVLMKLYIYSTEYGALFYSEQYHATISGKVIGFPGTGNTVTTPWFKTALGTKIDEILNSMSKQINEKLACVPFSTEIIAVRGNSIHINAGYLHGIRPGETLRVYPSHDVLPSKGTSKQSVSEGWIKVNTVFPNHSVASSSEIDTSGSSMDVGDVVRAW